MMSAGGLLLPPAADITPKMLTAALVPKRLTTIDGNLRVETGASFARNFISHPPPAFMPVHGNVGADNCSSLAVVDVIFGGNVSIQNCTGGPQIVDDSQIGGNFACSNNSGGCFLRSSIVNGNVQI
jgi:hypothetical protein